MYAKWVDDNKWGTKASLMGDQTDTIMDTKMIKAFDTCVTNKEIIANAKANGERLRSCDSVSFMIKVLEQEFLAWSKVDPKAVNGRRPLGR